MHLSTWLRSLFLFALLASASFSRAAESARYDAPLVVADGKFTHDGKTDPANLKNLVEFIRARYRNAAITLIDVEHVEIDHVTIQWRAADIRSVPPGEKPAFMTPLMAVLSALADASGHRLEVVAFSDNDFVLRPPGSARAPSAPWIEVFNLKPLLRRGNGDAVQDLQNHIHYLEAQRAVLKKRVEKQDQVKDLEDQIAVAEIQVAEARQPPVDVKKLLDQIPELVTMAMNPLQPGETTPDFKYHAGTNLLIVSGNERAVNVTRKVIDALARNP